MGDRIGFNGGYPSQQNFRDLENVAKYAVGTTLVAPPEAGPFDGMGLMLGISGATSAFAGGKWLWNNRADLSGGWANYKAEAAAEAAKLKAAGGLTSKSGIQYVLNKHNAKVIIDAVPTGGKYTKLAEAAKTSDNAAKALKNYESAKNAAEYAAKNPANAKRAFVVANKRLANAKALAYGQVKPTGFFGKVGKFLGKVTGFSKLNGAVKNFATKSPITASILKHGKGNGLFLGITAAVELFTNVIPTFAQLGVEKGIKQLGKSIVKTGASVGGWAAGAALGAKGGAIIGTMIGGPVGTFVGGLVGFIGGCVGSWLATKAANKVCGKNELDKAKEAQAKEIAQKAASDPNVMQQVIAQAGQRLAAEGNTTEDAKIAFGSLSALDKFQKSMQTSEAVQANKYKQSQPFTGTIPSVPTAPSQTTQPASYQGAAATNPFAAGLNKPLFEQGYMDKDFMAMSCGLV